MAGLQRTSVALVVALIPWLTTGCGGAGSRVASWRRPSADFQEHAWTQAQHLEKEGRLAEARQLFAHLHRTKPQSAPYAHRLGVVSMLLGEHEQAAAAFQSAQALDPNNPELLADAGHAACLRQEYAEAEQLLRASLALQADYPRAKTHLALAVGLLGRDDECEALLREVHGDKEVDILCSLADVKAHRGDAAAAAELYRRALAVDPNAKKAAHALAELKAEDQPTVKQAAIAAPAESTSDEDVSLALETRVDAEEPEAETDEILTDWTEDDTAGELAEGNVREFPDDAVLDVEPAESDAAESSAPVQVVTSDDSPTATLDAPVADEAEEFSEIWDEGLSTEPDQSPLESLPELMSRIAARSGQSGLMGFCPVTLRDEQRLADAQPQFTAEHQSQKYQFRSEAAKQKFEADPERYLPAAGGLDVVAVSQGTAVAQGSLEHALWFRHKLYLFLNAENRELFRQQARQLAVQQ
jgi:tetratricopeptide (TPR) repeat protein